jgi:hydrogenase expression/formation protein HypE
MVRAGGPAVHALRDPTRGGIASALNEIAAASGVGIEVEERSVPVAPAGTRRARCSAWIRRTWPARAAWWRSSSRIGLRTCCRRCARGRRPRAVRIGTVHAAEPGRVVVRTAVGSRRVLDVLVGEQLPRIC